MESEPFATAIQVGYLHYSPTAEELRDYIASYAGRVNQILAYFASYPEGFKTIQNVEDIPVPAGVLGIPMHSSAARMPITCTNAFPTVNFEFSTMRSFFLPGQTRGIR